MTSTKDHGGPAFPMPQGGRGGMTLRDYFAGQVLTGIDAFNLSESPERCAREAYRASDAMIKARK
jgi:hypothetical protein